jgi:CHAT domain-containing protein/tetratricopeptide (TPR) repeat protein
VLTRDQGKPEEAESLLLRALELARESVREQDPAGFVYFLSEPAKLYAGLGRWDDAIHFWEEALAVLSRLEVPHEIYHAQIMNDTAEALLARGDRARAEELFRQALEKRTRVLGPNHPEVGVTLTGLAQAVAGRPNGGRREAIDLLARALDILGKSTAVPEVEAEAWAVDARLERESGKQVEAIAHLERALALVEDLRPRRGGGEASRIDFLQRFVGYYNDMIAWLVESGQSEAALGYAERIRARVLHEQLAAGRIDLRRGIPTEARAPLERREREATLRISRIQQDITLARASWTPADRDGVARLARLEKEMDEASRDYREVIEEIQLQSPAWQRLLRGRDTDVTVRTIQEKLVHPDEFLLLYQIGPESSFLFVVPPSPQQLECRELSIPPDVAAGFGVKPGALGAEVLAALVGGKNEAERGSSVVGSMVRLRKVTGVAPIAGDSKTPPSVSGAHAATPNPDLERSAQVARAREKSHLLWQVLLPEPVWKRVVSAAQVVVVPDGSLFQLPFEALVVQSDARSTRYWLDVGPAIRYANSITTLLDVADRPRQCPAPSGVLTVSDPIFDPQEVATLTRTSHTEVAMAAEATDGENDRLLRQAAGLPRLPATARESAAIRRAFGPERVECLRGLDATETRVKAEAGKARYLHFATHGIVDTSHDDLLAGLMFTPPGKGDRTPADDGCLHLFEIYDLPLDCELAVLSACETEVGRHVQGEGVFALSRGFLVAGVQRTVASLWPVADESTALLVADFFRRVSSADKAGGPIDYTVLLRDAKRTLRRKTQWSDPFYWAPFVMSGVR